MARRMIRDFMEPAHPVLVRQYGGLVSLYGVIKEGFQRKIDEAFDRAAQQIGFVVTTTLPATFRVGEGGKIESLELGAQNLQGTIFQREMAPVLQELKERKLPAVAAGSYSLLLLWHEALKLRLKVDWMEPAHYLRDRLQRPAGASVVGGLPEVREPAHWFDAGLAFDEAEEVLVAAIDDVYPDLKLAERVAAARRESARPLPGVREPAHFRTIMEDVAGAQAARQLATGVREPAHFQRIQDLVGRDEAVKLLDELMTLLRRYGV